MFFFVGAGGFVGRHALARATDAGHVAWGTARQVVAERILRFDLLSDRLAPLLGRLHKDSDATRFGVVCASVRQIDRCVLEPEASRHVNVTATISALRDLADHGFTPVFVSTSYVFSGSEGYYNELDAVDPVCAYGRQKVEVERWMAENAPTGLVLRLDKVVGSLAEEQHLFVEWQERIVRDVPIECIAGQVMSPTNVTDIAAAVVMACERGLQGTYHVANPEFFSREELASQFCRFLGVQSAIIVKPQEAFGFADTRPLKTYLDSSAFVRATGMRFTPMSETWRSGRVTATQGVASK
jgi:dTDP-4-dehydrorhamnose reductase